MSINASNNEKIFSHSLTARNAALMVVETAKADHLLSGPINTAPELAEMEKFFFLHLFDAVRDHTATNGAELTPDEISSMFTFVFARSAEAVTAFLSSKGNFEFNAAGLFDGNTPFYTDDAFSALYKNNRNFPADCAGSYLEFFDRQAPGTDPLLTLFEALKWCFRIGCHLGLSSR